MKKLLTFLGIIGVTASTVSTVVACEKPTKKTETAKENEAEKEHSGESNNHGKPVDDEINANENIDDSKPDGNNNNSNPDKENSNIEEVIDSKIKTDIVKEKINLHLKSLVGNDALQLPDNIDLIKNNVINIDIIKNSLINIFENKISGFEQSKFEVYSMQSYHPPTISSDQVTNGTIEIQVFYDQKGEKKKVANNIKSDANIFAIELTTPTLSHAKQMIEGSKNKTEFNLSDLKLSVLNGTPLKTIFWILERIDLNILNQLPTQIPEEFNNSDTNWSKWETLLQEDMFRYLFTEFGNGKQEIELAKFKLQWKEVKTKANIQFNSRTLLNALLPTLINFRNYLHNQKTSNNNFILLLIKYLFLEPTNYKDDGYKDINSNVYINRDEKQGQYIFTNNLEVIIHNLLEGWSNKNNEVSSKEQPIAIQININNLPVVSDIVKNFKFQKENSEQAGQFEGIIDWLPMKNIENLVLQLFKFDSANDVPELNIHAIHTIGWGWFSKEFSLDIPVKIPLKQILSEQNLLSFFTSLGINLNPTNNLAFDWKNLKIQAQVQKSNNNWKLIETIQDLIEAQDLKITLNNKIKLKDKNENDG